MKLGKVGRKKHGVASVVSDMPGVRKMAMVRMLEEPADESVNESTSELRMSTRGVRESP